MRYTLAGLDCPNCAAKIERELRKINGLENATVNFNSLSVELPEKLEAEARAAISAVEPDVQLEPAGAADAACCWSGECSDCGAQQRFQKEPAGPTRKFWSMLGAGVLFLAGLLFNGPLSRTPYSWAEYAVFISAYLLVGWPVVASAATKLLRGRLLDESFLMTVATGGAIAIHQLPEAAGVMLFYAVGEYFQNRAVNRSRRSIAALLNIQPVYANLREDGTTRQVKPEEVGIGQLIVVTPGEKVPLDGEIVEGSSFLDTSALTGEAVPRRVEPGVKVLAGMINGQGLLTVKTEKLYQDSSVARILHLVEQAGERKAPTERFIAVFARYYTPAVVGLAALVALVPPLVLPGAAFSQWLYRALVLLVISCPCALMVSIPLGYFGGIGGASRNGILVKGANFLDAMAAVDTVVFDKTGTLTQGVFRVTEIVPKNGVSREELLAAAAAAETYSNHPIAQSIREAYRQMAGAAERESHEWESQPPGELIADYREIPAHGISALVNGRRILAGNDRLMHRERIPHQDCDLTGTSIYVAINNVYAGYLIIADELKPDAREAVRRLKRLGIRKTVMLTGDDQTVAAKVSADLGIDAYYAGLLPEEKVHRIEELEQELKSRPKHKLAFIGDGINDTPVITRADIGVAMGAFGSDAAIEAADVVLTEDNPAKLATALEIARRTKRIVRQNIYLALGIKAFFILLGGFGVASIWEAVFADVGVTVLAVLNASRTLRTHPSEMADSQSSKSPL